MRKVLCFALLSCLFSYGQNVYVDETFNAGGTGPSPASIGRKPVVLQDGKILLIGDFSTFNGISRNKIVKLNNDGTVDLSFDVGEGPSNGNLTSSITAIAVDQSGKILVGGKFNEFNGFTSKGIVRLNENGSVDTSFNIDGAFNLTPDDGIEIGSIVVRSDGNIFVGGNFSVYNSSTNSFRPADLVCFTHTGAIDVLFTPQGVNLTELDYINAMALQADGKLLYGSGTKKLRRLKASGEVDLAFNQNAQNTFSGAVFSIYCLPDGKILAWGFYGPVSESENSLGRLNNDGTRDLGFEIFPTTSSGLYQVAHSIDIYNGKYLIAGQFNSYGLNTIEDIALINTDGTLDTSFDVGGVHYVGQLVNSYLSGATVHNNHIYIAGIFNHVGNNNVTGIARLVGDGLGVFEPFVNKACDVFTMNGSVEIVSRDKTISQVTIYDTSGKVLYKTNTVNSSETLIKHTHPLQPAIIIVQFNDGYVQRIKTLLK